MHSVRKKCRGHDGAQRAPLENRLYLRNFDDVRVLPVEDQASAKDALTHLALDLRKTVILASITHCQTGKLEARLSYPYQVTPFAVRTRVFGLGFVILHASCPTRLIKEQKLPATWTLLRMPPDRGRASRACASCRKQKTRCYEPGIPGKACLRCERLRQSCSLTHTGESREDVATPTPGTDARYVGLGSFDPIWNPQLRLSTV